MSVVDNDREERRTLRREQPGPVEVPSWHDAGYRAGVRAYCRGDMGLISPRPTERVGSSYGRALAHLRWATDPHHGALTDEQVGRLARGIIAGLIDAGIAPEGVEA